MKNLYQALIKSKAKIENAVKSKKNDHLKYKYATLEGVLEAIEPIHSFGLGYLQKHGRDALGDYLETIIFHAESGESESSKLYFVLEKQTMQGLGSAITYARRYSLSSIFGIGQEDDDGHKASEPMPKAQVNTFVKNNKPDQVQSKDKIWVKAKVTIQNKDLAKSAGFSYNTESKIWVKQISQDEIATFSFEVEPI